LSAHLCYSYEYPLFDLIGQSMIGSPDDEFMGQNLSKKKDRVIGVNLFLNFGLKGVSIQLRQRRLSHAILLFNDNTISTCPANSYGSLMWECSAYLLKNRK
jgi:hypothetical protein